MTISILDWTNPKSFTVNTPHAPECKTDLSAAEYTWTTTPPHQSIQR